MEYPLSLLEFALNNIRRDIREGKYPPAYKLSPSELATQLGISQTPIKEALNRLVSEQIVELIPRRGYVVMEHSVQELRDLISVRKMIETYAADLAVKNAHKYTETMQHLELLLDQFNKHTSDSVDKVNIEIEFHCLIISLTGNHYLQKIYERTWNISAVYYGHALSTWPLTNTEESNIGHQEIYDCLKLGDGKVLAKTLERHVLRIEEKMGLLGPNK